MFRKSLLTILAVTLLLAACATALSERPGFHARIGAHARPFGAAPAMRRRTKPRGRPPYSPAAARTIDFIGRCPTA